MKAIAIGLTLAILASGQSPSNACSCIGTSTPSKSLDSAAAVFTGHVVAATLSSKWVPNNGSPDDCALQITQEGGRSALCLSDELVVTLEVTAAWKGVSGGRVEVRTHAQSSACGVEFLLGQSYLVYAFRQSERATLETTACSRTRHISDAAEDKAELGPPRINRFDAETK